MADRLSRSASSSSIVSSASSSPEPSPRDAAVPNSTAGVANPSNTTKGRQHPSVGSPNRSGEKSQDLRASLDDERGEKGSTSSTSSATGLNGSSPVLKTTAGALSPWMHRLQNLVDSNVKGMVLIPDLISGLPDLSTATIEELQESVRGLRTRDVGALRQDHSLLRDFAGKVEDPWLNALACFFSAVTSDERHSVKFLEKMKSLLPDTQSASSRTSASTGNGKAVPSGWSRPAEWGPEMDLLADFLENDEQGRFLMLRTLLSKLPDLADTSAKALEEKAREFRPGGRSLGGYGEELEALTPFAIKNNGGVLETYFWFLKAATGHEGEVDRWITNLKGSLNARTAAPADMSSSKKAEPSRSDAVAAAKPEQVNPKGQKQADLLANLKKHRDRYKNEFGADVVLFTTMVANALPPQSSMDGSYSTSELKEAIKAAKTRMRNHLATTPVKIEKKKVLLTAEQVEEKMQAIANSAAKASHNFLRYKTKYKTLDVIRLIGTISELFDRA